jgi:hypothetical protein
MSYYILPEKGGMNMYKIKFGDGTEKEFESLEGADLKFANLKCANLSWTDLSGANLSWTDLSGANLRDANLKCANLTGANLRWADLSGANLRNADLRGANIDFSCLPLWCGSLSMKIDDVIATQILYHVMSCVKSSPMLIEMEKWQMIYDYLLPTVQIFHRTDAPKLMER